MSRSLLEILIYSQASFMSYLWRGVEPILGSAGRCSLQYASPDAKENHPAVEFNAERNKFFGGFRDGRYGDPLFPLLAAREYKSLEYNREPMAERRLWDE
ncbi:hypothetical protein GOBAR_AA20932 [Gossypium barbadense]|uniref:Uncharacterized protein n=1 Tax=Gossypium barbadense TaxID=3634 RepID=A0A2P5X8R8_GOSBA|nr:hypothetical protein GOBAR_AA20932 [Gossypium barbadense]